MAYPLPAVISGHDFTVQASTTKLQTRLNVLYNSIAAAEVSIIQPSNLIRSDITMHGNPFIPVLARRKTNCRSQLNTSAQRSLKAVSNRMPSGTLEISVREKKWVYKI